MACFFHTLKATLTQALAHVLSILCTMYICIATTHFFKVCLLATSVSDCYKLSFFTTCGFCLHFVVYVLWVEEVLIGPNSQSANFESGKIIGPDHLYLKSTF